MRDPARIDAAVEALRAAWRADPDLRLGQLVYNATRSARGGSPCPELYNLEDGQMVAALEALAERGRPGRGRA